MKKEEIEKFKDRIEKAGIAQLQDREFLIELERLSQFLLSTFAVLNWKRINSRGIYIKDDKRVKSLK